MAKVEPLTRIEHALHSMPEPMQPDTRLAVAFSGGVDSTVLLAALARLRAGRRLRAIHVDHGLVDASARWAAHAAAVAASLGVDCLSVRVEVDPAGPGPEAAARAARYAAFERCIEPGEWLLTAHHADDQLETLLHRLARGAGVRGMRGIPRYEPFGRGFLVRPLLELTRAEVETLAREWRLDWVEDPSNVDPSLDRSYLRAAVVPALTARFPGAARAAGRLAGAMEDAEALMTALARADTQGLDDLGRLPRDRLRALEPARQRNALRYAIRELGLPMPDARQLETLVESLAVTRSDAVIRVAWPGAEARVFRDRLYLMPPLPARLEPPAGPMTQADTWSGPLGRLRFVASAPGGLPDAWVREGLAVGFRQGGERFRPAASGHRRRLKHWLQDQGIVPWMRDRIPLFYRDEEIVAIGDLWTADDPQAPGWRVEWRDHPRLR